MKKRTSLQKNIILVTIVPMIVLGSILFAITYSHIKKTMKEQFKTELSDVAIATSAMLDFTFPGDYKTFGTDSFILMKGEVPLNDRFEFIDEVKEESSIEISVLYDNVRFLTTIRNEKGDRILGTFCNDIIREDVLGTGNSQFYDNVIISGEDYFCYYQPLKNSDGRIVGMIGVAKASSTVKSESLQAVVPVIVFGTIIIILIGVIMFAYAERLTKDLLKLNKYVGEVAKGNLQTNLDNSLTKRGDELSQMGSSIMIMQRELRKLIEQDPLTGLNNRRSAAKHMQRLIKELDNSNEPFTMALGDIDFFKKVNDTYGHDAGDEVLKMVASTLKEGVPGKGFVSRWGGEEFLIGFSGMDVEKAKDCLENILNVIRNTTVHTGGMDINVTMSFGVAPGKVATQDEIVKSADDLLYYAKEHGRNRICDASDVKE